MANIRGISLKISRLSTFQQDERLLADLLIFQSLDQPLSVLIMQSHWHTVGVEAQTVRSNIFPGQINIHFVGKPYT